MFERFTNQSRRAVVLAQEEARRLDHGYIGTEHLLAGLTREEQGTAGRALESAGVVVDDVRGAVETMVGRGKHVPSGPIPFTPQAKKCLELSLREALQLGHHHVGTGHVLLALISMSDSMALRVLGELGTDVEQLRARVVLEIEDRPESAGGSAHPGEPRSQLLSSALSGLLDIIDERLTAIERHLGISRPDAGTESG